MFSLVFYNFSALVHENIAQVRAIAKVNSQFMLMFEELKCSLFEFVAQNKSIMKAQYRYQIMHGVACSIQHYHNHGIAQGIVHIDNFFVNSQGTVKLLKRATKEQQPSIYTSPDTITTMKSDMYGLGAICYVVWHGDRLSTLPRNLPGTTMVFSRLLSDCTNSIPSMRPPIQQATQDLHKLSCA